MKSTNFNLTSTDLAINNTDMYLGTIVNNTDSSGKGLYVSASGAFRLFGDSNNYLTVDGGNLVLKSEELHIAGSTFDVNTAGGGTIRLGAGGGPSSVSANTAGIYMDGAGDFQIYGDSDNYIRFDISDSLDIKTETFKLNTAKLDIDSSAGGSGSIALGATPPTQYDSGTGFFVDGSGKFLLGNSGGNKVSWNGSALTVTGTINISNPSDIDISAINNDSNFTGDAAANAAQNTANAAGSNLANVSASLNAKTGSLDGQVSGIFAHTASLNSRTSSLDTLETRVVIDNEGMALKDSGNTVIADYGTSIRIGRSGEGRVEIYDTGIDIYDGQATPRKRVAIDEDGKAAFGGAAGADVATNSTDDVVRIEPGSGVKIYDNQYDYAHMSSTGLDVYTNISSAAVKIAQFGQISVIGSDTVVSDSSTDDCIRIDGGNSLVSIFKSSTEKATIGADGLKVYDGDDTHEVARFGTTTYVGDDRYEHIKITNSLLEFYDGGTAHGSMTAGVWTIGQTANNLTRLQMATGSLDFIHRDGSGVDTYTLSMKPDGTIEGQDYIIEKTRLFGSGGFGSITLNGTTATATTGPNGIAGNVNSNHVYSDSGTTANIDRAIHYVSSKKWFMLQDCYFNDLTISGQAILYPNGHRLYVSGTLTVGTGAGANVGYIYRLGNSGASGALKVGGAAGATTTVSDPLSTTSGTLRGGGAGGAGGAGGEGGAMDGGGGGGGGSGGGIIFIAARKIINTYGIINVNGGNGGNGAQGVGE